MKDRENRVPSDFAWATLPMFFVLETSGEMHGQSIGVLNKSMENVVKAINDFSISNCEIYPHIGILQFHSGAHWTNPDGIVPVDKFEYEPLNAGGLADMGCALNELNSKLSRKEFLSSAIGICNPIIILITSGSPTDSWEEPLCNLKSNNRWYQNALKIGFAISEFADIRVLCDIVGRSGVVIQTNDFVSFDQIFEKVVINCYKQIWTNYITDNFEKNHSIEDVVSEVLSNSGLINKRKISVYSWKTMDCIEYEYVVAQTKNMDSNLKNTIQNSGQPCDDSWD